MTITSPLTQPYCKCIILVLTLISTDLVCQNSVYVCNSEQLILIDVDNCSSEVIGNLPTILFDIAYDRTTQKLYGLGSGVLYEVDEADAELTEIGETTSYLNALTFDNAGTLYAASSNNDNLYVIDTSSGVATSLGSTGVGINSSGDLTFYNTNLYLSGSSGTLIHINLDNLEQSELLGEFNNGISYPAFTSSGCEPMIYAFKQDDIYQISPDNLLNPIQICGDLQYSSVFGSTSLTESINPAEFDLGEDLTLCDGDSLSIGQPPCSGCTYLWQDGSTENSLNVVTSGTYWSEVSIENCSYSDTLSITFSEINIYSDLSEFWIIEEDTIELDSPIDIQSNFPISSVYWSPGSYLSDSTIVDTQAFPEEDVSYVLTVVDSIGCSSTSDIIYSIYVYPDFIEEKHIESCVNIYPNPISDQTKIQINCTGLSYPITVSILDDMGRTVHQETSHIKENLYLPELSAGQYIINLSTDDRVLSSKIIYD